MPRVLIVAPNLLYGEPNPRSIRARRLATGLAQRGFEVEVLTFWSGQAEPPRSIGTARVLAVHGGDPFEPGGLVAWGEAALRTLADQPPADVVYAIGVPVGSIVVGERIAMITGARLIADLGDPWTAEDEAGRRERTVALAGAAALVTTTEPLGEQLREHLPEGARILVAPNGGELRERTGAHTLPLVVHLGVINGTRVDPRPVYEVLAGLHAADAIEFRSHSSGWHPEFDHLPHPHLPMLSHAEALDLTASASAALVLGNDNVAQLPSKAFEIACTETWALCVAELADDPAAELLLRSGHGVVVANDRAAIGAGVIEILEREARGERPTPVAAYSWDARIDQIAGLLACGRLVP